MPPRRRSTSPRSGRRQLQAAQSQTAAAEPAVFRRASKDTTATAAIAWAVVTGQRRAASIRIRDEGA